MPSSDTAEWQLLPPSDSPVSPTVYRRDVSTGKVISRQPLLPDPYEARLVEVGASLEEGGGQGLFAKVDLRPGDLAALYNGVREPPSPLSHVVGLQVELLNFFFWGGGG